MHEDNAFEYFCDEVEKFFSLNDSQITKLVKVFNEKGTSVTIQDFNTICDYDTEYGVAESYFQSLCIFAHDYKEHRDSFNTSLESAKLNPDVKSKLKNFMEQLNETGINGLNSRFYLVHNLLDDPTLDVLTKNIILKEIYNDDGKLVHYAPIINLKFTFDKDGEESIRHAYFSRDQLKSLLNDIDRIYNASSESTKIFKNIPGLDISIIGE